MRDTLLTKPGIGRGLPDGVVVILSGVELPTDEITVDVVEDGEGDDGGE